MSDELTGDQAEKPELTAGAEEAAAEPTLADLVESVNTMKEALSASDTKHSEEMQNLRVENARLQGHIEAREQPEEQFNLSTRREYGLALDGMEARSRTMDPESPEFATLKQQWENGKAEASRFIAHEDRQRISEEKTTTEVDRFLSKRDIDPESDEGLMARWAAKHGMGLDRFTEKVLDPLDKYADLVAHGAAAEETSKTLSAAGEISESVARDAPPGSISKSKKTGHEYAQDDLTRRYENRYGVDLEERMFGPQ